MSTQILAQHNTNLSHP